MASRRRARTGERHGAGLRAGWALGLAVVVGAPEPARGDPSGDEESAAGALGGGADREGAAELRLPPVRLEPPRYSGAFRGLVLGGGPAFLDGAHGVAASLSARLSTVLHLADLELGYHLLHVPEGDATAHRLALSAQLHPLFPFLLLDGGLNAVLASLYVRLGIGPSLTRAADGDYGVGATWDWGVGVDAPIAGLEAGASFWLGALYLRSAALDEGPLADETVQQVHLRVGYRLHGF